MQDVQEWGLRELKNRKNDMTISIQQRLNVENAIICEPDYRAETRRQQAHLAQILKAIDLRYDEMTNVNNLGYEFFEDIVARERDKMVLNEDGVEVIEKFKTLVQPFDEHLLSGGFNYSSFAVIAGESNAGKSDILFMIIRGAIQQNLKIHLHSFEIESAGLFGIYVKDKLKSDFEGDDRIKKTFSVDTRAKELSDLKLMINMRADDGCRIFILDSTTKVRIKGAMALKPELIDEVYETLRELAHSRNLLIIGVGQKDKESKKTNDNELFGSVMQNHILDYLFFINYENRDNQVTTEREIVMIKNRGQDTKKSIITDYNKDSHSIEYIRNGGAISGSSDSKADSWAARIRR